MEIKSFLKNNFDLILFLTLYSFLAVISLKYYMNIGGDEISYINIAHAYAIGEWGDAINGYWSPLYSWLITPSFVFGFTPLHGVLASKILSLIIGFFAIISVKLLINILNVSKPVERSILFSLIPIVLYFALTYATPDLLLACILIIYLSTILNPNYSKNLFYGISCGFIGALAYLSKSYAFPFFIVHFLLFNLIYYFKDINIPKKKNVLKNLILGLSVFFIISGLWAGTISEKYGKLTISTAGEYNQAFMGPEYLKNPVFYMGLFKPPTKNSTSIWDDPSYIKMNHWSPFDSIESFKHQLKLIWRNIVYTAIIIESFFLIAFLIIIAIILFILKSNAQQPIKDKFIYLLITMFIYMGGYLLIIPEWRYLWPIFILLMIGGFYLIDSSYRSKMITKTLRNILLIILILSFTVEPVYETILFSSADNSLHNLGNTLENEYRIHGNVASNKWGGETLSISYYLGLKYYGKTKETNNSADLQKELKNNSIDYYIVWDTEDTLKLSNYKEITKGKIKGLTIYSQIK